MRLYLVQHAEAKSKEEDPSRPLTQKGFETISNVASYVEKYLRIQVEQIIHSGKLRAKQTAIVLADHLNPAKGIAVDESLEPLANPKIWKERLIETKTDIILVGHLPHLSKLTGQLLYMDESIEVVTFKMGGILCLEKDKIGRWTVQWMVTPEILP